MISHQHKCIFVHQLRCGGTSVIRALGLRSPDEPDWHYANHGVLAPEFYARPAGYFTFSTVRNPWDKFVSAWLHSGWTHCEKIRHLPLRALLTNLPQEGSAYRHVTRLQRDILYDASNKLAVDFLMRFETLDADWRRVCEHVGMPYSPLPHHNKNEQRRPYWEYFTSSVDRDLFWRHFQRDLDTFDYEF